MKKNGETKTMLPLNPEEQEILESVENDEWNSVPDRLREIQRYQSYAVLTEKTSLVKRRVFPTDMARKVEVLGDIVSPIADEEDWECLK
ncbi:MAG: hypothetical protein HC781_17835 [Leptolyngbyaceae cyanobacterium CSU_1_4]|nr:hypothetical protein [Leptolyngbyaceae cyanobacterium CSU_1_4]